MTERYYYLVMSPSPSTVKNLLHRVLKGIRNGRLKVLKNLQIGQSWNFVGVYCSKNFTIIEERSDPEENDDESDDEEQDVGKASLPELILDKSGYPKLPSRAGVTTRGQQELVRQIFRASYSEYFFV
jgi:hypothetical protein